MAVFQLAKPEDAESISVLRQKIWNTLTAAYMRII